jgi:hypothetical protein
VSLVYAASVRSAQLDALEADVGTAPVLRLYSGSVPAGAAASVGAAVLLAEGTLPSDWMAAASAGGKGKSGTWTLTGQAAAAAGTAAAFFRLYASDGTTPKVQGTVSATSGGGDMQLDNNSIASGQQISVSAFTLTAGNA